jgi:hypothetical protein
LRTLNGILTSAITDLVASGFSALQVKMIPDFNLDAALFSSNGLLFQLLLALSMVCQTVALCGIKKQALTWG